jgi:hypothetical protein
MQDPFVGTWTLNPAKSQFDPNHRPTAATMRWQLESDGGYLLLADGTDEQGQHRAEKPQKLFPDGRSYPIEAMPGLTCVTSRPDPNTVLASVKREDGSIAGEGRYSVADDGRSMTATTAGFDTQLRRFEMRTVWERT